MRGCVDRLRNLASRAGRRRFKANDDSCCRLRSADLAVPGAVSRIGPRLCEQAHEAACNRESSGWGIAASRSSIRAHIFSMNAATDCSGWTVYPDSGVGGCSIFRNENSFWNDS